MKFSSSIQIWFLDADPVKSAQYLTNDTLNKSIYGSYQALVAARFYFIGIHNKKAYKYYFNDEHRDMTLENHFPNWPIKGVPLFSNYSSRTSKWCRQCVEHYEFIKRYFNIMLDEYEFRFNKQHGLYKFADWLETDAPILRIPYAHLKQMFFPWKVLSKKYRNIDIVQGYRNQLMATFENNDPWPYYMKTRRDIPDFVVKHFGLNL